MISDSVFNFEAYKDNIALISCNAEISYSDVDNLSILFSSKIRKRSLVFLVCTNTIDSIISYIGIIRSGAVCILIKERNFDSLLEKYKPEYIVAPSDVLQIQGSFLCGLNSFSLYKTDYIIDYEVSDDLAILLSTSGSTGSPKFVKISYQNIISNSDSISDYLNISSIDRAVTTMPMNYSYGLSIIHTHLRNGASIIVTDSSLMGRELWDLMKNKKATNFGGVPYTYQMLKKLRFERIELPSLRYVTQAGGKLSQEQTVDFHNICSQKNIDFFVMYGQTEATARMAYLPARALPGKAGSIGCPIPGGEFFLEDTEGKVIEVNETVGELIYYGKNVSIGYSHNCNDLNGIDSNKGCLHTGDLAKRDAEGYYYIVGRKNRFIKVFGNRVNLDELEQIINGYGIECVCTGQEDEINIYVTDSNIDTVALYNKVMLDTGLNKSAFNLVNIDKIPRNDSGKVIYSNIAD
jgi:acyl-coenzyme A synthetase/AMP-(fatty) acid ligase